MDEISWQDLVTCIQTSIYTVYLSLGCGKTYWVWAVEEFMFGGGSCIEAHSLPIIAACTQGPNTPASSSLGQIAIIWSLPTMGTLIRTSAFLCLETRSFSSLSTQHINNSGWLYHYHALRATSWSELRLLAHVLLSQMNTMKKSVEEQWKDITDKQAIVHTTIIGLEQT